MVKKILIVDDEPDIVSMVQLRLAAAGYEVLTAENGNDGYSLAKSACPDLIILDIMLPDMDGYQVCRLLKFDQKYKNIPVIMLTAKSQKTDREWGGKVGADLYMTKPFDLGELLQKVNGLLEEKNG